MFILAEYYYRIGLYEKAAIIQRDNLSKGNKRNISRTKRYLARSYISLAKYDQARPMMEEALIFDKNTPNELIDRLYLSLIYLSLNSTQASIADLVNFTSGALRDLSNPKYSTFRSNCTFLLLILLRNNIIIKTKESTKS